VVALLLALALTSNVQEGLRRSLYPLNHEQTIRSASQEYGIEPALVAAVIHTESEFDPDARSDQNAYGLMQIVPDTARNISRQSGIEGDYREPRVNIRMGVWYLDHLEDRYAGSERLMLAAYNSGEGTVDGWLQDESFNVRQDIPYPETASYVVDVRESRDAYAELYGSDLGRTD
jgi:soluble lytic murein transglycosylase